MTQIQYPAVAMPYAKGRPILVGTVVGTRRRTVGQMVLKEFFLRTREGCRHVVRADQYSVDLIRGADSFDPRPAA